MAVVAPPLRMADMGVQRPQAPATAAEQRARFFNSANAFNVRLPAVPAQGFADQALRALQASTPTGHLLCDQAAALGSSVPATTPWMLAGYARILAGESLAALAGASGSVSYVIAGNGSSLCTTAQHSETLQWGPGDVLCLPGSADVLHRADGQEAAVLWTVNDAPLVAHQGLRPVTAVGPDLRVAAHAVHYPAAEIARQLAQVCSAVPQADTSGRALIFSTEALEASHNLHPVLTLSLNTLAPGESQPAHRHNSAAVTLVLDGQDCFSLVDGHTAPWQPWLTMVTPPGAPHSHHNQGPRLAKFLIVQDGGLHYQARTMGFTPL